ncbi:phosphotransferase, partial [Nonomuraea sp. NPDC049784]|uniref:phosphotransferase n=1 Tax=Nonomuraea sp. NPDC049784 TaxID=3154361 RepID=UPI0033F5FDE3
MDTAGQGRGGPLAGSSEWVAQQLASATELGLIPDPDAVRAVWDDAAAAPGWDGPALWLHGDLHPANILTADGTICGVIDFGPCSPAIRPSTSPPPGLCCRT